MFGNDFKGGTAPKKPKKQSTDPGLNSLLGAALAPNAGKQARKPHPSLATPAPPPQVVSAAPKSYIAPPKYGSVKPSKPKAPNPFENAYKAPGLGVLLKSLSGPKVGAPNLQTDALKYNAQTNPSEQGSDYYKPLQNFLQSIKNPKAPVGYQPGMEHTQPGDINFAWVPKNARTNSDYWNQNFIKNTLASEQDNPTGASIFLNQVMGAQLADQLNWIKHRNYNYSQKVINTLSTASEDAYNGKFDTLQKALEQNPNLLHAPSFRSQFGVTPRMIRRSFLRKMRNGGYQPQDEEYQNQLNYTVLPQIQHYNKIRASYQASQQAINQAVERYQGKYDKAVKAHPDIKAGPAIPDVTNQTDKHTQFIYDQSGDAQIPKNVQAAKHKAMVTLGLKNLPTVKQMLALKVQEGQLDPSNQSEIFKWMGRFENPNHPDTRAMYVAWAAQHNPNFDTKTTGLEYINGPIKEYVAKQDAKAAHDKAVSDAYDHEHSHGVWDTIQDTAYYMVHTTGDPSLDNPRMADLNNNGVPETVVNSDGTPETFGQSALGWTLDKMARPMYAVAAMWKATYDLDKNQSDWSAGHHGWFMNALTSTPGPLSLIDPVSTITGKSWLESAGDAVKDPGHALHQVLGAGAQQFFPNSFGNHNVAPVTWEQIIKDANAHDGNNDIYDQSWYQHIAGFSMDVAADPLNFVGIGIVDDALKTPVKAAKIFAQYGRTGTEISRNYLLRRFTTAGTSGPVAEKAARFNAIMDPESMLSKQLSSLDNVPRYTVPTTDPVGSPISLANGAVNSRIINSEIQKGFDVFRLRANQVAQQTGVTHLNDEMTKVLGTDAPIVVPTLRVNYLTQVHGDAFYRMGKDIESLAYRQGFTGINVSKDAGLLGNDVRNAESKLANWDTLDRKYGSSVVTADERAAQQKIIDDAIANEGSGVTRGARTADYLDSLARHDKPFEQLASHAREQLKYPKTNAEYAITHPITNTVHTLKPREIFAKELGVKPENFPLNDHQILEAIVDGPRFAALQDPALGRTMRLLADRIKRSRIQLTDDSVDAVSKQRSLRNLNHAQEMLNNITHSGIIRHMQDQLDMMRNGHIYNDPELASKYQDDLRALSEVTDHSSNVKTFNERESGTIADREFGDESPWDRLKTADLESRPLNEILKDGDSLGFKDGAQFHEALIQEIKSRLRSGQLDRKGKLTGLTPQEAYNFAADLEGTPFLKTNGDIDEELLNSVFKYGDDPHFKDHPDDMPKDFRARYAPMYAKYKEILEPIRGAIDADYAVRYDRYTNQALAAKRAAVGTEGKAFSHSEANYRRSNPEPKRSDPIKSDPKFNSAWHEQFPEGFVNRGDLQKFAMQDEENLYKAVYESGSPIKFKGPGERVNIGDKRPTFDEPAKLRNWASKTMYDKLWRQLDQGERTSVDEYMRQVASKNYEALKAADSKDVSRAFNDAWNNTVKAREHGWNAGLDRAKITDTNLTVGKAKAEKSEIQLEPWERAQARRSAQADAKREIIHDLVVARQVRRNFGNESMTLNETVHATAKAVKREYQFQRNEVLNRIAKATQPAETAHLNSLLRGIDQTRADVLKQLEAKRTEAVLTQRKMRENIKIDVAHQAANMPLRVEKRALQLRVMGMHYNLITAESMLRGAEVAQKLLPSKTYEAFMKNFVRPSKQFSADMEELVSFRAMWTGKTPMVIAANLKRLGKRMGEIPQDNRTAMFKSLRDGTDYIGPHSGKIEGIKQELRDIESAFNGTHEAYKYQDVRKNVQSLRPGDFARFLNKDYSLDVKELYRLSSKAKDGKITSDMIFKAMQKGSGPDSIVDPYRFAYVLRLAMDQAQQSNAIHNLIRENFGSSIAGVEDGKIFENAMVQAKWEKIPEISNFHYFPPESVKDIKNFLELMTPGTDAHTEFMKNVDKIMGNWKMFMTIPNPGYYSRNGIGEIMTSWLAGISHPKYYRMSLDVLRYMTGKDKDLADLIDKWAVLKDKLPNQHVDGSKHLTYTQEGVSLTADKVAELYGKYGNWSVFANTDLDRGARSLASAEIQNPFKHKGAQLLEGATAKGEHFEHWLRMAHFIGRMEKLKGGSLERKAAIASKEVRKYHVDYADFSKFEQTVMLRAFPFYKWTRRGAPLMLAHMFMTPGKITAIPKAMNTLQGFNPAGFFNDDPVFSTSDIDEDKNGILPNYSGIAPSWVQDLFAYQMNPTADDEYANYIRIATPQMDGLNAVFGPVQGTASVLAGNQHGLDNITSPIQNSLLPLLSPLIKAPVELGTNRTLDPNMHVPIVGGKYNETQGINPVESLIAYAMQNVSPDTGFLAKLSKHHDLPALNMGNKYAETSRAKAGYDQEKDWASFLTGLGFYQGMPKAGNTPEGDIPAPVDQYDASKLPEFRGASAAHKTGTTSQDPKNNNANKLLESLQTTTGKSKSKWINYKHHGYKHYKHYGHRSYSSGSGSGSSSTSAGDLLALILKLQRDVDQGTVIKE